MNDTPTAPQLEAENRVTVGTKKHANKTTWRKGQVTNPKGRPKVLKDVQALCRESTAENVARLRQIAATGNGSESVAAIKLLMAYGYGQPHQSMTLDGTKQDVVVVTIGGRTVEANRPAGLPSAPA